MDIIAYTLEKKIPIAVQLNLTSRCNLKCIHCCVGKREGAKETVNSAHELDLPQIRQLLEQLARAGCLVLTLSGGEVLLREDLVDIITCARSLDFAVKVFTNGTLLGKREAEAFRKLHLQEVHVSLYAAEAGIHDAITGVTDSWTKTMEGIRQMREKGVPVKIKCAVMRQNFKEYRKVYELAVNLGANYAFDPIITARDDRSRDTMKYRIDKEDLQKFLHDPIFQSIGEMVKGKENSVCLTSTESICLTSTESEEVTCSAGHHICFVSPEGDVTPCVQLPIFCGNVLEHDFNWIWRYSPEMVRIRQFRMKDIRGCNDCRYLLWCARCPGLAYLEDGDLLGPSSAACWMAEARGGDRNFDQAS